MWEAFYTEKTGFTLSAFAKFFQKSYYWNTILNSFKVSGAVMLIPGAGDSVFLLLFLLQAQGQAADVCAGALVHDVRALHRRLFMDHAAGPLRRHHQVSGEPGINIGSIYGFEGILLVQALKLFPLVLIYMNGAFQDIDSTP
jgi:iron(III) transport system permease protein